MRIRRLSLRTWRGVSERDISFGDGVTLIEGANEVGKSTLVEALRMLFREQDSSKKKDVRAIQPVGQDVGSAVEAEVECGEVHFTYAKTYNRRPGTELQIHAPRREHLTGGDAHNRAREILEQHMDITLWDTLLVEQGHALGAISLADSSGLAQALDAASGGRGASAEGSVLLEAARGEYARYFTPKAGKPLYADQEAAVVQLEAEVESLEQALQTLDEDLRTLDSLDDSITRLQERMPELQANEERLGERWSAIAGLEDEIARAQIAREPLLALLQSAREKRDSRQQRSEENTRAAARIEGLSADLEPENIALRRQQADLDSLGSDLARLRQQRRDEQDAERRAQNDLRHLADASALKDGESRLERLQHGTERATGLRRQLAAITMDAQSRRRIEAAHADVALARSLQERGATRVEMESVGELQLTVDGELETLPAGETLQRYVLRPLRMELPGGVVIRLTPGTQGADPAADLAQAEAVWQECLARHGVSDLAEAIAADERRQALQRELEQLESVVAAQLSTDCPGEADLASRVRQLQQSQSAYLAQRGGETELPADRVSAERALVQAQSRVSATDAQIEAVDADLERQRARLAEQTSAHRQKEQELMALRARQAHVAETLTQERLEESDDTLATSVAELEARLAGADGALQALRERLQAQDPDTARALLDNAMQANRRASDELIAMRQDHAVVQSRLQRSRASGQQEALAAAEQRLAAAREELASTQRRAAAAALLWERLNHFRDATQRAYVRPLQAQIERLGRIVFGPDFGLTLGDDWTIVECTRDGTTLAFADLSVGAQEQLGILTRLAAAQIVSTHGGVPVIIDDALGFSDPERLRVMGAAIAAAGEDAQIIILSCTPDRYRYVGSASVVKL